MGRFKALCLLAVAFATTLVKLALGLRRRGLEAFHRNYDEDGLAALTVEERAVTTTFGTCIACGICDRGEGTRIQASKGAYPGVMTLILAGARSMPDYAAAARGFGHVEEAVLAAKELECPAHVPMRRIARFVRDKAGQARISLAPRSR